MKTQPTQKGSCHLRLLSLSSPGQLTYVQNSRPFSPLPRFPSHIWRTKKGGQGCPSVPRRNRYGCLPVTPAYPMPPLSRRHRGIGMGGGGEGRALRRSPRARTGRLSAPPELEDGQQDSQHPHRHPDQGDGQPVSACEEHAQHKGGYGSSQIGAEVKQPHQRGDGRSPLRRRGE